MEPWSWIFNDGIWNRFNDWLENSMRRGGGRERAVGREKRERESEREWEREREIYIDTGISIIRYPPFLTKSNSVWFNFSNDPCIFPPHYIFLPPFNVVVAIGKNMQVMRVGHLLQKKTHFVVVAKVCNSLFWRWIPGWPFHSFSFIPNDRNPFLCCTF